MWYGFRSQEKLGDPKKSFVKMSKTVKTNDSQYEKGHCYKVYFDIKQYTGGKALVKKYLTISFSTKNTTQDYTEEYSDLCGSEKLLIMNPGELIFLLETYKVKSIFSDFNHVLICKAVVNTKMGFFELFPDESLKKIT